MHEGKRRPLLPRRPSVVACEHAALPCRVIPPATPDRLGELCSGRNSDNAGGSLACLQEGGLHLATHAIGGCGGRVALDMFAKLAEAGV